MPAVSEEELAALQEQNAKLRERLEAAQTKKSENEIARLREHEALQLQAENVRLEAQVSYAEAEAKVGSSKDSASGVIDQAKEQLAQAKAVKTAQDKAGLEAAPPDPQPTVGTPPSQNGGNS
jgi:hypothetical protein